jgi:tetratricopeptide (TPR) repeat protein
MGKKQDGRGKHLYLFFACMIILSTLLSGCIRIYERVRAEPDFQEARDLCKQGNFQASLKVYDQIIAARPHVGDIALFEMGIIYTSPDNGQKDYQKALECFRRLGKNYPLSSYKENSEVLVYLLDAVISGNNKIILEISSREKRMVLQRKQIETLEQQVAELEKKIAQIKEVDMSLEKRKKSIP